MIWRLGLSLLFLSYPLSLRAAIGEIDADAASATETEVMGARGNDDFSALWVRSGERIFLIIEDSKGRKTGVDPRSKDTLQKIPNSTCETDFIKNKYTGDFDELNETITLQPIAAGRYTFYVTGLQHGPYEITLTAQGRAGSSLPSKTLHGLISEGEVKTFALNFKPDEKDAMTVFERKPKP